LDSFGTQVDEGVLQYWTVEQSASRLQPPEGMQTPALGLHAPDRQTVPPFRAVQGPSPLA
jgi:hypothetical protein